MARRKYTPTLKDLAAEFKRDVATIHRWGGAGAPCTVADRGARGYAIAPVVEWAEERGLLNGKQVVLKSVDTASRTTQQRFLEARAREREEKARLAEIQRRQLEGEIMPIAEHREAIVERHLFFRSELEALVRRLPPRLTGKSIVETTAILRGEVDRMMRTWSEGGSYSAEGAD